MDISNRMGRRLLLVCFLIPCLAEAAPEPFEFRDGDRIVLLGNTFIEREGSYGYIETSLTRRFPHKSLTFRNLGYSAETVRGESRAMFDTPKEGFQRMVDQVVEASPTVIFLAFGSNAAYQGEEGLGDFLTGYRSLVEILDASTDARFVMLSPPALERLEPPLPDPEEQNARVAHYVDAIRAFAEEKGFFYVDLFHPLLEAYEEDLDRNWTDNTVHFNPYGYWRVGLILIEALGFGEKEWKAILDLKNLRVDGVGTRFDSIHYDEKAGLELLMTDRDLPIPNPPLGERTDFSEMLPGRTLWVSGLLDGDYELRVDENLLGTYSSASLSEGIEFPLGLRSAQVERLRQQIQGKSQLFFYRWRPQNWTYLYGFRKHEQGRNARETPLFEPLIDEVEEEISQTKIPVVYRVELIPAKGGAN